MFGLGIALIGVGLAGIGGMGTYYFINSRNRIIDNRKINNVFTRIEEMLREAEAEKETKEVIDYDASLTKDTEEYSEPEESNVISLEDVFENFEKGAEE